MGNSLIKNHKARKKNCKSINKSIKYMYTKLIVFFPKKKKPFKAI